jgi:hypothetical protein
VEGAEFRSGEGLTPAVEGALDDVVDAVLADVQNLLREEERCTSKR